MQRPATLLMVFRTGGDFRIDDAIILNNAAQLACTQSQQLRVVCLTDIVDKEQVRKDGLVLRPLCQPDRPGRWTKMEMFAPWNEDLRPALFLDLDTFLLGNIDEFLMLPNSSGFVMLRDLWHPPRQWYAVSAQ